MLSYAYANRCLVLNMTLIFLILWLFQILTCKLVSFLKIMFYDVIVYLVPFWYFLVTKILCYCTSFNVLLAHISCFWINDQGSHGKQEFECMISEFISVHWCLSLDLFKIIIIHKFPFSAFQFQACPGISRNCYRCRLCCNFRSYWPWGLFLRSIMKWVL